MYTQSITRANRALFVIAIDQSCSMAGELLCANRTTTKAEMVAEVANDLLAELLERSRRSGAIRDYYDIALIGYSGEGVVQLLGSESGAAFSSISQLESIPHNEVKVHREYRLPNGELRFATYPQRRWIEPVATGSTPMYEALLEVHHLVEEWSRREENRNSFPPMIFNITDGESTDCDYSDIAEISSRIKSISTNDGATLLINIHIASSNSTHPLLFPSLSEMEESESYSSAALSLFNSSSVMPPIFTDAICDIKATEYRDTFKGVSFNCSISELISILNIGSISLKQG